MLTAIFCRILAQKSFFTFLNDESLPLMVSQTFYNNTEWIFPPSQLFQSLKWSPAASFDNHAMLWIHVYANTGPTLRWADFKLINLWLLILRFKLKFLCSVSLHGYDNHNQFLHTKYGQFRDPKLVWVNYLYECCIRN